MVEGEFLLDIKLIANLQAMDLNDLLLIANWTLMTRKIMGILNMGSISQKPSFK